MKFKMTHSRSFCHATHCKLPHPQPPSMPVLGKKLNMDSWGWACPGVLNRDQINIAFNPLLYRLPSSLPASRLGANHYWHYWYKLRGKPQGLNANETLIGPWTNYNKLCISVLTPAPCGIFCIHCD